MSRLKQYLSMEDAVEVEVEVKTEDDTVTVEIEVPEVQPVTEAELDDAHDDIDEVEEELSEMTQDNAEVITSVDEVNERIASVESFLDVLEHGIETEQYSPQFAAMVGASLEQYRELFGLENTPSLENYSADNLNEFYTVSQESFRGFLSRLSRVIPAVIDRNSNKFIDAMKSSSERGKIKGINKIADAALDRVARASGTAEVNMRGSEKLFNMGGTLVTNNFAAAIKKDQSNRQQLMKGIVKPYLEVSPVIRSKIGEVVQNGGMDKTKQILEGLLSVKMPGIPADISSGKGLLRGRKVHMETTNVAGAKLSERLEGFGKTLIRLEKVDKPKAKLEKVEFTPKDVAEIAKLAKGYAVLFEQCAQAFASNTRAEESARLFNQVNDKSILGKAPLATWEDDKSLDRALTATINIQIAGMVLANKTMGELAAVGKEVAKLALRLSKEFKSDKSEE